MMNATAVVTVVSANAKVYYREAAGCTFGLALGYVTNSTLAQTTCFFLGFVGITYVMNMMAKNQTMIYIPFTRVHAMQT